MRFLETIADLVPWWDRKTEEKKNKELDDKVTAANILSSDARAIIESYRLSSRAIAAPKRINRRTM